MRIRIYPAPRGTYKDLEFDTSELPCTREAQNGFVHIEEIAAQENLEAGSSQAHNTAWQQAQREISAVANELKILSQPNIYNGQLLVISERLRKLLPC